MRPGVRPATRGWRAGSPRSGPVMRQRAATPRRDIGKLGAELRPSGPAAPSPSRPVRRLRSPRRSARHHLIGTLGAADQPVPNRRVSSLRKPVVAGAAHCPDSPPRPQRDPATSPGTERLRGELIDPQPGGASADGTIQSPVDRSATSAARPRANAGQLLLARTINVASSSECSGRPRLPRAPLVPSRRPTSRNRSWRSVCAGMKAVAASRARRSYVSPLRNIGTGRRTARPAAAVAPPPGDERRDVELGVVGQSTSASRLGSDTSVGVSSNHHRDDHQRVDIEPFAGLPLVSPACERRTSNNQQPAVVAVTRSSLIGERAVPYSTRPVTPLLACVRATNAFVSLPWPMPGITPFLLANGGGGVSSEIAALTRRRLPPGREAPSAAACR